MFLRFINLKEQMPVYIDLKHNKRDRLQKESNFADCHLKVLKQGRLGSDLYQEGERR